MNCFGIAVLRVLNQEYHQKGDNGRSSVDDQLPGIGKMKSRASKEPDDNDKAQLHQMPRRCRARWRNGARKRGMRH